MGAWETGGGSTTNSSLFDHFCPVRATIYLLGATIQDVLLPILDDFVRTRDMNRFHGVFSLKGDYSIPSGVSWQLPVCGVQLRRHGFERFVGVEQPGRARGP